MLLLRQIPIATYQRLGYEDKRNGDQNLVAVRKETLSKPSI